MESGLTRIGMGPRDGEVSILFCASISTSTTSYEEVSGSLDDYDILPLLPFATPVTFAKNLLSYNALSIVSRVVTATDGQTHPSVRPSVTSDKARVRHIRVNGMLTSKRVKPELLCPRWLPHRCHVGSLAITL
jgi:hypothetical protein